MGVVCGTLLMTLRVVLLLLFLSNSLWKQGSCTRPQCHGGLPPFEPQQTLEFCRDFSEFGCCTELEDSQLRTVYDAMNEAIDSARWEESKREAVDAAGCRELIRDIMCQTCSPYEKQISHPKADKDSARTFPSLCSGYCEDFYSSCVDLIQYVSNDTGLLDSLGTPGSFCSSDLDSTFCYPDISSNDALADKLSQEYRRTEGQCLCLETVAENLHNPLLLQVPPGEKFNRLFVAEQRGVVRIFHKDGTDTGLVFLDLSHLVLTSVEQQDERGFLGMAFHPDYQQNGRLFLYYSVEHESQHKTRISEFTVHDTNPNKVNVSSERVILELVQPYEKENGGELLFGIDDYLYVFLGDGGGGLQHDFAQNKSVLLGKVLRLDVDNYLADTPYAYGIPGDNPFVNQEGARAEIYAYGVRNMWRCDVDDGDPQTGSGRGRILCGEVGHDTFEEINIVEKGGNYGWNWREGLECTRADGCNDKTLESEVLPIHVYLHSEKGQAVIGGHVYRGCTYPNLQGLYFFGDFVSGKTWRLQEDPSTGQWSNREVSMCSADVCGDHLVAEHGTNILSFGEDDDGELYLLTTDFASTTDDTGKIFRFVDPRRRADPSGKAECRTGNTNGAETSDVRSATLSLVVWTGFILTWTYT